MKVDISFGLNKLVQKMKVGGYVSNWTVQKTKAGLSPKVDDPEIKK